MTVSVASVMAAYDEIGFGLGARMLAAERRAGTLPPTTMSRLGSLIRERSTGESLTVCSIEDDADAVVAARGRMAAAALRPRGDSAALG
jgi:hypothetical protein